MTIKLIKYRLVSYADGFSKKEPIFIEVDEHNSKKLKAKLKSGWTFFVGHDKPVILYSGQYRKSHFIGETLEVKNFIGEIINVTQDPECENPNSGVGGISSLTFRAINESGISEYTPSAWGECRAKINGVPLIEFIKSINNV